MDFTPYIKGIKATGFPLEHYAAEQLRAHGWSVMSNRYYVDDDEEKSREIDILAYKATTFKEFDLRTAIVVSCKKSEQHHWTFLTRNVKPNDPNSDFQPVHFWTNHKPLEHVLSRSSWPTVYHQGAKRLHVSEVLSAPLYEIFAFQESYSGTPKGEKQIGDARGDSHIFASVMSALKAQLYEMSIRPDRPGTKPIVYQFNLLCLADTKFVRLHFEGEDIAPSEIERASHFGRYIVKRQHVSARVIFSTKQFFGKLLSDFDRLHDANKALLSQAQTDFYKDIERDEVRLELLIADFRTSLYRKMRSSEHSPPSRALQPVKEATLRWNDDEKRLNICVNPMESDLEVLNNASLRDSVRAALKETFRYEGDFVFADEIPF